MRVLTWKHAMIAALSGAGLASSLTWAQMQPGDSPFDNQPETRLACERLKAQIDQTIRDNGARHFLLEIVDNAQVEGDVVREGEAFAGAEVVGSCDGGTRKVVYSRDGATEMSSMRPAAESSTPVESSSPNMTKSPEGGDGSSVPETAPVPPESSGEEAVPTQDTQAGNAAQEPEASP
ncbi:DUF1161 domain-containing protein [Salinicola corii]|uniref:DUF1161 domain-containing protein n=1 Tax=Salinicola corii TaxID=2606937 RepID=A0A640WDE0_9GAMM|nr:DUF1161 domain-containing protein [Salinicola corii]KAA0017781.1 DUF1161 domain-containing protein [Salinicola corii]